jgi:osmotically-inducible protein OsmY
MDRTIARRINERLDMDPQLADCDIAAYAHLGHVWLVGRCQDFGQVEHATQTVRATDGVLGITRLLYPPDEAGDDRARAATARRIRDAVNTDRILRRRPLSVDVVAGKAVLMGLVPTEAERGKVVDIARKTRGVAKVLSYIAVVPDAPEDETQDGEPS